jgi:hypothetical protein
MWKKISAVLFVFIIILSLSTNGYAVSMKNAKPKVDISKYQVNVPKEDSSSSNKKTVLVSGNAPKDTSIVIDLYGAVDLTGENYTLAKLPKDDEYVLISSQTIKSGPAGFGEEIELIMGINKVIVTFNVDGVPAVEKIIYYYEAEQLDEAVNKLNKLPAAK